MVKHVYLHVGTPRSGTTYLHAVLWRNEKLLADNGVLLPGAPRAHYTAAKGVTSRPTRRREDSTDETSPAWPRLVRLVNRFDGSSIISHELFAPATREQADAAKALLDPQIRVHVVLTVRALQYQLPASWLEQVKGGMAAPFDIFLDRVADADPNWISDWFWSVQDVPDLAVRWGHDLPPERVHIVTVPPSPSEPAELWRRFATAVGINPIDYDSDARPGGEPLGAVEAELMRRLHAARDERFTDRFRHQWTRRLLAAEVLGDRPPSRPMRLPDDSRDWVDERNQAFAAEIKARGYDVIGSFDDLLRPAPHEIASRAVTEAEVEELSGWVISRLQEELVRREPAAAPPPVGPDDGVDGVLELLEHIRAADTGAIPRSRRRTHPVDQIRKRITALRNR